MKRLKYSFLSEDQQDPAIDPNNMNQQQYQDPNMMNQADPNSVPEQEEFEPLIKDKGDIPASKEGAEKMLIAAKIREIEAKTKETLAKASSPDLNSDPNGMAIDPTTGMPMDPNMAGGQIDPNTGMPIQQPMVDPMTGMPMDPNAQQQNDPLQGLGDASAPQDMNSMGAVDPTTGMPMDQGPSKTFTAIGRAFKLKKIYDILDSLSKTLHTTPDNKLQEISIQVDSAFELFRLVVNNLKIYKDKVDDLIIMYYSLLKDICEEIENTYKEKKLKTSLTESKIFREFCNYQKNILTESTIAERLVNTGLVSALGGFLGMIHGSVTDSDVMKVVKQKDPELYYQMKQDRRIKHTVYGVLAGLGIGIRVTRG